MKRAGLMGGGGYKWFFSVILLLVFFAGTAEGVQSPLVSAAVPSRGEQITARHCVASAAEAKKITRFGDGLTEETLYAQSVQGDLLPENGESTRPGRLKISPGDVGELSKGKEAAEKHLQSGEVEQTAERWKPPLVSVTGFVLMLLSIAVIPLAVPHWWESNKNKAIVSGVLSLIFGTYVVMNDWVELVKSLHEYEQFLILLASLFVISSGIWLSGDIRATPRNNTIFIGLGTLLASFIGTTGASMLLIRPVLQSNSERQFKMHTVIFFIFLVSNIGGSLTPLGDPPLFLGYLRGVPFSWTFTGLSKIWLPTSVWLLLLYFFMDTYFWNKESDIAKKWDATEIQPLKLRGAHNFLFLLGVIAAIYFYPRMLEFMVHDLGIEEKTAEYLPVREVLMILMAVFSWFTTRQEYRQAQNFTWNPILEVAILFFGIFVTMIPALLILYAWGPTSPVQHPWHFFWATGILSSFLDNAPTYLTYLSLGLGQGAPEGMAWVMTHAGPIKEITLLAISAGAVFMGANTYIGNAPNFMVKTIAEENNVKMPSFFGFMGWSIAILIPTFIALTFIFFL